MRKKGEGEKGRVRKMKTNRRGAQRVTENKIVTEEGDGRRQGQRDERKT